MFRNNIKAHAFVMAVAFAIGMNFYCLGQNTKAPFADTPTQRWLPAPTSYPTQQEKQAKLLALLRDSILQSNGPADTGPSNLSDAEVQSLKDAMKQFENYFPEGLTADSLDAIPPEWISKALSNPELMKQAREIAGKQLKENQTKKSDNEKRPKFEDTNLQSNAEKKAKTQVEKSDLADLMNKLRSTQQNYQEDQNQKQATHAQEPLRDPASNEGSGKIEMPRDLDNPFPPQRDPQPPYRPQTETNLPYQLEPPRQSRQHSTNSNPQPSGKPSTNLEQSNSYQPANTRRNIEAAQTPNSSLPKVTDSSLPRTQRADPNSMQRNLDDSVPSSSGDGSVRQKGTSSGFLENEIRKLGNDAREAVSKSESKAGQQSNSSLDIRSELDRRGFGPTMQKIIEEAQRASKSARAKKTTAEPPGSKTNESLLSNKEGNKESKEGNKEKNGSALTTKQPKQSSPIALKPTESKAREQKTDSPVSKSMQKTGDYLNKLFTGATKSSTGARKQAARRPLNSNQSSSTPFGRAEIPAIPNPFNAQFLQCILVLAVASVVVLFVMKMKFKQERERKIALESQMAPKIDEIESRDDVVRAFHAMARQRLQSAQTWWTCGHVTERFQESLPEHTQPILALSGLYEQARYYPTEHQLSADQIQSAKLALKQCEG